MNKLKKATVVLMSLLFVQTGYADGEVEAKYRQGVMKSIGGHMSAIGTSLKNQVHLEDLAMHARGIAMLADVAPNVFPAGSGGEKTKARPEIWEDPDGFSASMNKFVGAAKDMAVAAESGDMAQIGPAVQALGGSCKGCHDDYKSD